MCWSRPIARLARCRHESRHDSKAKHITTASRLVAIPARHRMTKSKTQQDSKEAGCEPSQTHYDSKRGSREDRQKSAPGS